MSPVPAQHLLWKKPLSPRRKPETDEATRPEPPARRRPPPRSRRLRRRARRHRVTRHPRSSAPPLGPEPCGPPPTPPPPREAREDGHRLKAGITCQPGEPGNALGDWESLKIRGELHLHDAGHALQHHPLRRRPLLSRAPAAPAPRAEADGGPPKAECLRGAGLRPRGSELPGADWQRASDVRAGRAPRGRGRPRAPGRGTGREPARPGSGPGGGPSAWAFDVCGRWRSLERMSCG